MRAVEAIKGGLGIADSFRASGVFPPMFISMLNTGEETGRVDDMLHKVADFYEDEAKLRLHQSIIVLTQCIFGVAAVIVGIIVIHFYENYFESIFRLSS
jgi:type II secretory pathway component PulF